MKRLHSILFFVVCFAARHYKEEGPRYVLKEQVERASLVDTYVNVCTRSLSEDEFEEILAEDVALYHQTNGGTLVRAQGKNQVLSLFSDYVFTNSLDIVIKNIVQTEDRKETILFLSVEETKDEEGTYHRYHFEEETHFQFSGPLGQKKISQINMKVTKTPL